MTFRHAGFPSSTDLDGHDSVLQVVLVGGLRYLLEYIKQIVPNGIELALLPLIEILFVRKRILID